MTDVVDLGVLSARFEVFLEQQRGRDAVEMLKGQADHHADQPLYWVLLGRAFAVDKRFDDAEQAGRRALELAPDAFVAQITLLIALLGQDRPDEATSLAWSVVEQHPEEADAHYYLSASLLQRRRDRQDLVVAHQAARHALSLQAEAPTFAQAARAASVLGDDGEARAILADGLAQNPQDRELLLLSGRIKGGERVVGPREEIVGGILRQSPLDRSAEADLASSPLRWVRARLFQLWYTLLLVSFVAVLPMPSPLTLVAVLVVVAVEVALAVRTFRKLEGVLPSGYLKEQLADPARGRRAFRAYGSAQVLILLGSVLVAVVPGPGTTPGDVVLVLAAVVIGVGLLIVVKAQARLDVADHSDGGRDMDYHLIRWGDNGSSFRRYWLAALTGAFLMMATAMAGGDATGGAGMLSVGILWTIKTFDLIALSRNLPNGENPWVRGVALSQDVSNGRTGGGRLLGARFILLLLFVCAFTSFSGYGAFIGGFVESASPQ